MVLVAMSVCAGCGPAASRADDANVLSSTSDHLDESSSAVATAQLAVRARAAGALPAVTADATLGDAAETATGAVHGIGTLVVSTSDTEQVRATALAAASDAVGPVTAARTWLGRPAAPAEGVLRALDDASGGLDEADAIVERALAAQGAP